RFQTGICHLASESVDRDQYFRKILQKQFNGREYSSQFFFSSNFSCTGTCTVTANIYKSSTLLKHFFCIFQQERIRFIPASGVKRNWSNVNDSHYFWSSKID